MLHPGSLITRDWNRPQLLGPNKDKTRRKSEEKVPTPLRFLASDSTLIALVDQKMQTPSGCFAKSKTGVDGKVAEGLFSQQGACQHACGGGASARRRQPKSRAAHCP